MMRSVFSIVAAIVLLAVPSTGISETVRETLLRVMSFYGKVESSDGKVLLANINIFSDQVANFNFLGKSGEICEGSLTVVSESERIIDFDLAVNFEESMKCPNGALVSLVRSNKNEASFLFRVSPPGSEQGSSDYVLQGLMTYFGDGMDWNPNLLNYDQFNVDVAEFDGVSSGDSLTSGTKIAATIGTSNPMHDGIYVVLKDGSYVQMEELVRADSRLHFGGMPYAITRPFGDPASNRPAPVVDIDEVRSIFVKSSTDIITGVQPVFNAEELLFQGAPATSGVYVRIGDKDFESSQFEELFASSDCSYAPDLLNRTTISSTEYELVFEGSRVSPRNLASAPVNTKWSAINPVYDPSMPSKCVGSVSSSGFSVIVEGPTHRGINTSMGPLRGSVYWVRFSD